MNRAEAPSLQPLSALPEISPKTAALSNGTLVHQFNLGEQAYVHLQFVFPAGRIHSDKVLLAELCAELLLAGTSKINAAGIAEQLDFYGASVEPGVGDDDATINVYCLSKQLPNVLPLVSSFIDDCIFPQQELDILLSKWKQRFRINLQKSDQQANRLFRKVLFSDKHIYGRLSVLEDYDHVDMDALKAFYQKSYVQQAPIIIAAGKLPEDILAILETHFGKRGVSANANIPYPTNATTEPEQAYTYIEKEGAVQSSIRMGRRMPGMGHPDHSALYVLNTILGGYFGSRLMDNIREDKGYTYGIHSSLLMRAAGPYLEISTEVNKDVLEDTLKEIKIEFKRLIDEPVDAEELDTVKNYILGQMLRSVDGALPQGKLFRRLMIYGFDMEHNRRFAHEVREVSASRLQELAAIYLREHEMCTLIVG
jgi:zinc protease